MEIMTYSEFFIPLTSQTGRIRKKRKEICLLLKIKPFKEKEIKRTSIKSVKT